MVTGGSMASTSVSSAWSQGWSTAFVACVTPLARTSPVAGRSSVSSLAVPPRTYSWGWSAGLPTVAQVLPGWGMAWYGPASSWHQSARPAASASRYARSMAPFFLPSADRPLAPPRPCACAAPCPSGTRSGSAGTNCLRRATRAGSWSRPRRGAPPGGRSVPGCSATRSPSHLPSDPVAAAPSPRSAPAPPHRRSVADLARLRSPAPPGPLIEPPYQIRHRAWALIAGRSRRRRKRLSAGHRQQRRRPLHPIHPLAARLRDRPQLALLRDRQRPQALLLHGCHDSLLLPCSIAPFRPLQPNAA